MVDLVLLQHCRQLYEIFILEAGPALARGSEHIVFLIVSRQEKCAIGSSPSSSPSERSYDDEIDCVLHLRLVFPFVFDPTPSSCPCFVDRMGSDRLYHQSLASICHCLLHEIVQLLGLGDDDLT